MELTLSLNKELNQTRLINLINENWPKFMYIEENVCLIKNRQLNKETKYMTCDCTTSEQERMSGCIPCGDDCLNRMLMIECGSRCACNTYCTNKQFQRKEYSLIYPFLTSNKGWGLKALQNIKSGAFIIEYIGEVIDLKELKKRCQKYTKRKYEHFYFMSLVADQFIDATKKGGIARFFNHSCDPNCETQKWNVDGELRIGFFARRTIVEGEELTVNYNFENFGEKREVCLCGSENCRGFLSNSSSLEWDDDNEEDEKCWIHLQREIKNIRSLNNKDDVLKLCRLMIQTENLIERDLILDVLLNTSKDSCLKLFIDYHGLTLLWSWMIDIDRSNGLSYNKFKLKTLDVLSKIPIQNRTIVEETKLFVIVKRWSALDYLKNKSDFSVSIKEDVDDLDNLECISSFVYQLVDFVVEKNESDLILNQVNLKAQELYDKWSNLQLKFKIPKKQQNEERQEHERDVNDKFIMNKTNEENNSKIDDPVGISRNGLKDDELKNYNEKSRNCKLNGLNKIFVNNHRNNTSELSKEERRLLFEEKNKDFETRVLNNKNSSKQKVKVLRAPSSAQQKTVSDPYKVELNSLQLSEHNLLNLKCAIQHFMPSKSVSNEENSIKSLSQITAVEKHKITQNESESPTNTKIFINNEREQADVSLKTTTTTSPSSQSVASSIESSASTLNSSIKKQGNVLRNKLSKLIVKLLQPYLRNDCKIGRITNTNDFKYLARKFTHSILDKELSRATKPEDLELTKRVKIKTQEYITKYMLKFNGAYIRKS